LPPEREDTRLEAGRAVASPRRARRGARIRLRASGLRPQQAEGPVDLTVYAPRGPRSRPGRYGPDPGRYEVLVEATLAVRRVAGGGGIANFVFASDRNDARGHYVAVFRRTDVSSYPVASCTFELR
jgi:hypothetical protein